MSTRGASAQDISTNRGCPEDSTEDAGLRSHSLPLGGRLSDSVPGDACLMMLASELVTVGSEGSVRPSGELPHTRHGEEKHLPR